MQSRIGLGTPDHSSCRWLGDVPLLSKVIAAREEGDARVFSSTLGSGTKALNTQKPPQTLRKEYGSLVNQAHGIHAGDMQTLTSQITITPIPAYG